MEKDDVKDLSQGSKVVLLKWGVFEILTIDKENWKLTLKYHPEDKNFKDPTKITWLTANKEEIIEFKGEEYDYLLTEDKAEGAKDFTDIINKNSLEVSEYYGEGVLKSL